jgi:Ca2+-binding RTX toxin-like protein
LAYLFQHSGGEFVANTAVGGDQRDPKVIKLASGGFLVLWMDVNAAGGVKGQIFDAAGAKVGVEIIFTANGGYPDVASLPGGGFVVTWNEYFGSNFVFQSDIRAQIYDASGATVGSAFTANSETAGDQISPFVTPLVNGGFAILWSGPAGIAGRIFDGAGAAAGGEFAIGGGPYRYDLAVATFTDGRFAAAWGDGNEIKAQIFSSAGAKLGSELVVEVGGPGSGITDPSLAALSNGGFVVSWTSAGEDGSGEGIKAQIFDSAGNEIGAELFVNTSTAGDQKQSSILALANGGFLISWTDSSTTGILTSVVRAQAFNADGTRSGSEFLVSRLTDSSNTNHGESDLVLLDSGNVVAVWHGSGPGDPRSPGTSYPNWDGGIRAQIFSPLSAPTLDIVPSKTTVSEVAIEGVAAIRLATTSQAVNGAYTYSLISDSTGGAFQLDGDRLFVVDNDRLDFETAPTVNLTLRATDHAGNSIDEVVQLTIGDAVAETRYGAGNQLLVNTQQAGIQQYPVTVSLASGGFVVAWNDMFSGGDGSGSSVKAQLYDSLGNKVGGEFLLNTSTNSSQDKPDVVALPSGGFVVSWTDSSGTGGDSSSNSAKAQIFDAAGNKVGGEILVNSETTGFQGETSVALLPGGGFVVSWMHNSLNGDAAAYEIRAQRFDASGNKLGGEVLVNTVTTANQTDPSVAGVAGGGFVVSWTDSSLVGGDNSGTGIKTQLFDAAGAKVGGETLANTTIQGGQIDSSVLALGTGYVVIWGGSAIRGQIFDAAGNKVGAEFKLNTTVSSFDPSIAALPSGGFIVSWGVTSSLDGSNTGVAAQMFDSAGNKVGDEFLVNEATNGFQHTPSVTALPNGSLVVAFEDESASAGNANIAARIFADANAPLAKNDSWETLEAQNVAGNVLSDNGSGADRGAGLQVTHVNGSAALVGQQIALPSGASFVLNADGTFSYSQNGALGHLVPMGSGAANEKVVDTFTYTISGGTAAIVTIQVNGVASAGDQYRGTIFDDAITGTEAANLFLIHQGNPDTIFAGGGDDVVYLGKNLHFRTQINGGSGNDVVELHGSLTATTGIASFTDVEKMALLSSRNDRFGGGDSSTYYGYNLTFLDYTLAAGQVITIDASDLRDLGADKEWLHFDGSAEADGRFVVIGGQGNDSIFAGQGADTVNGGAGDDQLSGNAGNDTLNGGEGRDTFYGGAGDDTLAGGVGDDVYMIDDLSDLIVENAGAAAGSDEVQTGLASYILVANVEKLSGTGGLNQILIGNGSANIISAWSGNDRLDGGAGADQMIGRDGNDVYIVDNAGDTTVDQSGMDTVEASVSYSLGADIERLVLTGTAVSGTGNALANIITGNAGNNVLDGGLGSDSMIGGLGNDIYFVDSAADSVSEQNGAGTDTVRSTITYTLGDWVENLELLTGALTGTGNGLANVITGNAAANTLDGKGGADSMAGGLGDDIYVVDNAGDILTEGTSAGTDTVRSFLNATLGNNVEHLVLLAGALNGTGNSLANGITGNGANNVLNGMGGADVMAGGAGHDTYHVDNAGDVVTELASAGNDTVFASTTFILGDNVESLTLTGTGSISGTGNGLNNIINGNIAANFLNGGLGADFMTGGGGDDTYFVDNASDKLTEAAGGGTDTVNSTVNWTLGAEIERLVLGGTASLQGIGNDIANVITGNAAANILNGGIGADTMQGGLGNDTFIVDNAGDVTTDTGGVDTVQSSVTVTLHASIDNLLLTGAAAVNGTGNGLWNVMTGNGAANTLDGGVGNDILNGGLGTDTLIGGAGHDTYHVDNVGDQVIDTGGGNDHVHSSISYVLGTDLEYLTLTGTAVSATGNAKNNLLYGNAGNNVIDGLLGADFMVGGMGDDTYYVENGSDQITEHLNQGTDTVMSTVHHALRGNIENLTLIGTNAVSATGNELNNVITGNSAANALRGGLGADTLSGGGGNDSFVYRATNESTAVSKDQITGFNAGDKVNLSVIDAIASTTANNDAFTFIGANAFNSVAGELRATETGGVWTIEADVNGDGLADLVIGLTTEGGHIIGAGDFIM